MFLVCVMLLWGFGEHNSVHYLSQSLEGSQRRVILADAYTFGATHGEAMGNRRAAWHHWTDAERRDQVLTWNGATGRWRWEREMEWRFQCWDALEDALYQKPCRLGLEWRLQRLERLYDLLGEDDFRARRMPSPTPFYRVPWP